MILMNRENCQKIMKNSEKLMLRKNYPNRLIQKGDPLILEFCELL